MSIRILIKKFQDIMRGDDVSGTVQYLRQMIWMIFLKIYDAKEKIWEIKDDNYQSIIPENLKWRSWAIDNRDGKALTGDDLIKFVNNDLIDTLKKLEVNEYTQKKHSIVKYIFEDASNLMKKGIKLRQLINLLNKSDFTNYTAVHEFGDLYESMLKDLQESKRDGGEFYTPRALTDFIVEKINPCLSDSIADFACGTGGFLISALKHLEPKVSSLEDKRLYRNAIYGIEKKSFPYSLGLTNLILHDVDEPHILHDNSLNRNVREYSDKEKFDIIIMNPPYGGKEDKIIQKNFPVEFRTSETADLFIVVIMYRIRKNGHVGIILPDSFLFGIEKVKRNLKEKLLKDFNLHTVLRLPKGVFSPYTSIATNIFFFNEDEKGSSDIWFYRMDMPDGYKAFSKTKPIKSEHFETIRKWWNNRKEIVDENGNYKSKKYTREEIIARNYNLDLCGSTHKVEEILPPDILLKEYSEKKKKVDEEIKSILDKIINILNQG